MMRKQPQFISPTLTTICMVALSNLMAFHACAQSTPQSVTCSEYYPIPRGEKMISTIFSIREADNGIILDNKVVLDKKVIRDKKVILDEIVLHETAYTK